MATYSVAVDWSGDGSFTGTGEDVTSKVLASRSPVTMRYGRDQARSLAPTSPAEAGFELNNVGRDYSPENASSPLFGNLAPGRQVRIQASHAATTYTLFRGFVDNYELHPEKEDRSASFGCLDALAKLNEATISTALHGGVSTGTAIGHVLDAIGWPALARDLDTGATWIPWWWEEGASAWDAIQRLVGSEGSPAYVSVDGDGRFVFRDRMHRITRAASTSVQATFRDTGTEPCFSAPLGYDIGWRDVINSVSVSVDNREAMERQQVWRTIRRFILHPGQTVTYDILLDDPAYGIEVVVNDAIITGNLFKLTATIDRTSGQSLTLTVEGTDPVSTHSAFVPSGAIRLYGYPVRSAGTEVVTRTDATSITKYGLKSLALEAPWADANTATALADLVLLQRAERVPTVQLRVASGVNGDDTRMTHMLARDLSDRVHVLDAETGLDADFFVESIAHTISSGGYLHETVFGCEKAVAMQPTGALILGTGLLGTGKLAR